MTVAAKYIVFKDPNWDWRTFELDRDLDRAEAGGETEAADAMEANLSAFAARGGKLLMYHGWSDALVAPRASIKYYERVLSAMGGAAKTAEWIRLFVVPGMGHCRGGDGPNTFDVVGANRPRERRSCSPTQPSAPRTSPARPAHLRRRRRRAIRSN
jgi:feruloyl esterase